MKNDKPEWHNVHGITQDEIKGKNDEVMQKYGDIIDLPHHVSTKHKGMSVYNRAAQFAPFAALTGYDDAIRETGRQVSKRIVLSDTQKERLDFKLVQLMERDDRSVSVIYFKKDAHKAGGEYIRYDGVLRKIDEATRAVVMTDGTRIRIDDIYDLNYEEHAADSDMM